MRVPDIEVRPRIAVTGLRRGGAHGLRRLIRLALGPHGAEAAVELVLEVPRGPSKNQAVRPRVNPKQPRPAGLLPAARVHPIATLGLVLAPLAPPKGYQIPSIL